MHAVCLLGLASTARLLVDFGGTEETKLLGITTMGWFLISLLIPVIHQVFVWVVWRSELCFGACSKVFGSHAFGIYRVVFFSLLLARPISLVLLSIADRESMEIPIAVRVIACTILGFPAVYAGYSVVRYFGMLRASGADHFDTRYRDLPLVKQGIFRYTDNAMYTYAFLGLWIIGIAAASWLSLVVAALSHVYIWVHYFCTEKPDMDLIYGFDKTNP